MVQLAPRFAFLLAFCFLASATPILNPLDPFVSLSAGVGQPTAHLHDVARAIPTSVLVNLLNDGQNPSAPAQANHKARALPVSVPVGLLNGDRERQNSNTSAQANHTARAVPVSVLVDILKDGHEQQNPNTFAQANHTARAVPASVPADTVGHYIPGVQDNALMGTDTQTKPGQGSSGQDGPVQGKGKRDDGQYHPNAAFNNGLYTPTPTGTYAFDDGQYHPNSAYDNGQYHPNSAYDNGQYHSNTAISATVTPTVNPTNPITDPDLSSGVQAVPSIVGVATSVLLSTITVTVTSESASPTITSSSAAISSTSIATAATSVTDTPAAAATSIDVPTSTGTPTDTLAILLDAVKVDKRYEDGQYHPDPTFNDGLYHPNPNFDDGQYHPTKYDRKRGLVHQGKVRSVRKRVSQH